MEVILAIDGGGSRTRCLAINRQGEVVGEGRGGPSNHLLVEHDVVTRSLEEATVAALEQAGLKRDGITCLSAGLAGVDYDGVGIREARAILSALGFSRAIINGDMVIAHAGALCGEPGVLALAGTGSSILGINKQGERVKVGGWGPLYGDDGSAYRIGQRALVAAARAYDECGPATSLLEGILRELNLSDFRETVTRVYVERMESREIASLSRVVNEVALAQDQVARDILTESGEELAEGVVAAIKRLGMEHDDPLASYEGSVMTSCTLARERFIESLKERLPQVHVKRPQFAPVIGAYLIGCKVAGWTVDENLSAALRQIKID